MTDDDRVIMASETGVIDIDQSHVVKKGRLQPGRMFLVDTARGRIVDDEELKLDLAREQPYADWLEAGLVRLEDLPERVLAWIRRRVAGTAAEIAALQSAD